MAALNPFLDPATIEAIEADMMASIYRARRLAGQRLAGTAPPPRRRSRLGLSLLQRAAARTDRPHLVVLP